MFHFGLGPMFLSAFLRDWGVISFDILTVTVMITGSWSQLEVGHNFGRDIENGLVINHQIH